MSDKGVSNWHLQPVRRPLERHRITSMSQIIDTIGIKMTTSGLRWSMAILAMGLSAYAQAAADPWSHAQPLVVIMVDNRFQPDHLIFHPGQPYRLHLENHGKSMHEFTAPGFLKAARIRDKARLASGGTDIVVQPGKTVDIVLIAPTKGTYDLTCADHDWDGMTGSISVE